MNDAAFPEDSQLDIELTEVLAEYLARIDRGEAIARDEIQRRHPVFAEQLLDLLDTAAVVDQMAGPVASLRESSDGPSPTRTELDETRGTANAEFDSSRRETVDFSASSSVLDGNTVDSQPPRQRRAGSDLLGETFGDFELLSVLGEGGMGVVFKARQISMNRLVAVKMIRSGRLASDDDIRRFYREAQAAGKTGHPNIVTVYQVGERNGYHFFAMDYVEGRDLSDLLRQGPLPARRAAQYLKTIAEAIHAAHENGVLHRDLKPANVLLNANDQPLVTDFGLAKQVDDDQAVTATGATLGTPSYMSPEQAAGKHSQVGPRSDVYALGAILYAMLTARPPFRAANVVETLLDVIHRDPAPPRTIHLQADLELSTICLKCLHKDPDERYQSAAEVAAELDRFLRGQPIQAKPLAPLQRLLHWWRDVPLVAAVTGRRMAHPTTLHHRVQLGLLALLLIAPLLLGGGLLLRTYLVQRLPPVIRFATGHEGGMYHALAGELRADLQQRLDRPVRIEVTSGSQDNRTRLGERRAQLALLQAASVDSEKVAVVAPLYYEVVHVIARRDSEIRCAADLAGHAVSLGEEGSGMRLTALTILRFYKLDIQQLRETTRPHEELLQGALLDAAIVTSGLENPELKQLLASGGFRLVPLEDTEQLIHPTLRPYRISAETYPQAGASELGTLTLATAAFLTTYQGAPDRLVTAALEALYNQPPRPGRITRGEAAEWPALSYHPAARLFFAQSR